MREEEDDSVNVYQIGSLVVFPVGLALDGFVIMKFWSWFLVPALGVREIPMGLACGVGLLAGYLSHKPSRWKPESWGDVFNETFFYPLFMLLIAWLVLKVST